VTLNGDEVKRVYADDIKEVTSATGMAPFVGEDGNKYILTYSFGKNKDLRALLDPADASTLADLKGVLICSAPSCANSLNPSPSRHPCTRCAKVYCSAGCVAADVSHKDSCKEP